MFLPNLSQDTTEPKLSRDCTFDDNHNTLIVGSLPRFLKMLTKITISDFSIYSNDMQNIRLIMQRGEREFVIIISDFVQYKET